MSEKNRETLEILCGEVEIPEIVSAKAEAAFQRIRMSGYMESGQTTSKVSEVSLPARKNTEGNRRQTQNSAGTSERRRPGRKSLRHGWTIGIAAACAALTVSVGAAVYREWSRGLEKGMQADENQISALESEGYLSSEGQSVTDQGVTVTVMECLADQNTAFLSFKVEGYTPEGNLQPEFQQVSVTAKDGSNLFGSKGGSSWGGFYNGIIADSAGKAVYDDGSEVESDENGNLIDHYVADDGSLEYDYRIVADEQGTLLGKTVLVSLKGLGYYSEEAKADDPQVAVDGEWDFELELPDSDNAVVVERSEALGDSQAVLTRAEITPLSTNLYLTFPREEITETGYDQDGNEIQHTDYAAPPQFLGYRLKDGTDVYVYGGGTEGYTDTEGETWHLLRNHERIVDTSQIESLLFLKNTGVAEGAEKTDEDMYIISLKD